MHPTESNAVGKNANTNVNNKVMSNFLLKVGLYINLMTIVNLQFTFVNR